MDGDSPETVTAGILLGIQHPPGYPLTALLARLAGLCPAGNPCFRVNGMSAVLASLGVCLFASNALFLLRQDPALSPRREKGPVLFLTAVSTAFLVAFSRTYWGQALGAKGSVYLLQTVLLLLLLRCLLEQAREETAHPDRAVPFPLPGPRWFYLGCFLFGCGLAHHWPTQVLFFPFLLFFFRKTLRGKSRWSLPAPQNLVAGLGLGLLGLSPLLYLPLRSHLHPFLDLGAADNASNFLASLFRKYYAGQEGGLGGLFIEALTRPGTGGWARLGESLLLRLDHPGRVFGLHLVRDLGLPAFLLALVGSFRWFLSSERKILGALLLPLLFLAASLFLVAGDPHSDWILDHFLLPANWVLGFLALAGWSGALSFLDRLPGGSIPGKALFFLALAALPVFSLSSNFRPLDQELQVMRFDYGQNLLKSLPSRAVFFSESDADYFPLYYLQGVEGLREDVRMVPSFLLFEPWGTAQVERLYPGLGLTASEVSFPDHFARIIYASSEIVVKSRGKNPVGFSYFDGAFHRYYLARHPSLQFRKSGAVLLLDDPSLPAPPLLPFPGLRLRDFTGLPSGEAPALRDIGAAYRAAGLSP